MTSGGSTVRAIEAVRAEGHEVGGVVAVLDRLAGGADAIRAAAAGAPYEALVTIDDIHPDRPDRTAWSRAANRVTPALPHIAGPLGRTPRAGFEPAAYSLGGSRSIRLSYRGRMQGS